jgi:hypothetical protein
MDKHVARVFNAMNKSHDIRKATLYLSPTQTIKISRQHRDRRSERHTYLLTVGEPNYLEKRFIASCKKAGEKFPVRKIQLKHYKTIS